MYRAPSPKSAKRSTRRVSIRTELIATIILFALMPALVLSVAYYARLNRLADDKVALYADQIVTQTRDAIESIVTDIDIVWKQLVEVAVDAEYLYSPNISLSSAQIDAITTGETFLKQLKRSIHFISNVYLLGLPSRSISSASNPSFVTLRARPWVEAAWDGEVPGMTTIYALSDYEDQATRIARRVLTVVSRITPYGSTEESVVVVMDIDYDVVLERIDPESLGAGATMVIYSDSGRVLYHPRAALGSDTAVTSPRINVNPNDLYFEGTRSDSNGLVISHRIANFGWILAMLSRDDLAVELAQLRGVFRAISGVLVIVTVILSWLTANRISRPLLRIISGMRRIQVGDFTVQLEESGPREFSELAHSFHLMQAEIESLLKRIALKERETLRAELLSLQSQINPHFLYNTMDVIRGIAYEHGVTHIANMAEALGNLFRYAKDGRDNTVSLRHELEHLGDYVRIQAYRFGDRFSVRINVPEQCLGLVAIRFMLQPIVENAFQHGIERRDAAGVIELTAMCDNGDLVVRISDNGVGMTHSDLVALQQRLDAHQESNNASIGLSNVHNRIRMQFGAGYGVTIESEPDVGTTVSIRLPRQEVR